MNNPLFTLPESPLQTIYHPLLKKQQLTLQVKRDDLLHPLISGNKWRKLKYNLLLMQKSMQEKHQKTVLTFGGAFSNHIYATAAAGKLFGFNTIGVIRTDALDPCNSTLRFAKACGMRLIAVDRKTYRKRHEAAYQQQLLATYNHAYLIPEGGTNHLATKGVQDLVKSLPEHDYLLSAVGSGGTLAGLINASDTAKVLGVAVLKQADYLRQEINALTAEAQCQWQLLTQFHGGGYGRFSPELWQFCQTMHQQHQLPLEPIYTGKLFYALWQLIEQGYFKANSRIIAIHTGGLQGLQGLRYRGLI